MNSSSSSNTNQQQQQRPSFVLSFHILNLRLVDRAPHDEGWERGFKQNWAAPANRISCRLVQSVTTPENLVPSPRGSSTTTKQPPSDGSPMSPPPSLREKVNKSVTSQILATTPPLTIDEKTLSAVTGGIGRKPAATSSQQQQPAKSNNQQSLLVVPNIESLLSSSPVLLMELCRHTTKNANVIECRTTFNLVAMVGSLTSSRANTNTNTHTSTSNCDNNNDDDVSFSSLSSFIVEHTLMHPVSPLCDSSIFVVATVALTKQSLIAKVQRTKLVVVNNKDNNNNDEKQNNNEQQNEGQEEDTAKEEIVFSEPPLLTAVPHPPPSTLERLSGSIRLSTTDLFVPSLLFTYPDPSAHLISNVLVVGNATESQHLLVKIQSNSPTIVKPFPANGTVIGPRQRAFFSITFTGAATTTNDLTSSSSASSPAKNPSSSSSSSSITLVKSSHLLQQLSNTKIEVTVQDVNTGEAHHSVPLRLHLRKADQGQPFGCAPNSGGNNPYHFWINSVSLSNRFHDPMREMLYVKSVLPVFLMKAPSKEDMMSMAKDAINQNNNNNSNRNNNTLTPSLSSTQSNIDTFSMPTPPASSSNLADHNNINNNSSHGDSMIAMSNNRRVSDGSALHSIDLATSESFIISVNFGVLKGLLVSSSSLSVGLRCPTYKIVASPLPEAASLRRAERKARREVLKKRREQNDHDDVDDDENEKENDNSEAKEEQEEEGMLEFLRFETGEVYPSTAGNLRWDMPLVFRRKKKKKNNSNSNNSEKIEKNGNNTSSSSDTIPWQNCRIGLRLVEIPAADASISNTTATETSDNNNNNNNSNNTNNNNNSFDFNSSSSNPANERSMVFQQQQQDSNNTSGGGGSASSQQGNVIAEAILAISIPAPLSSVPTVLSQPLVFAVRPCYPQYDALKSTCWMVKGTVVALAGNV